MPDELDGWCDDCADDTRHEITDFDPDWVGGTCTGCGRTNWFPVYP